MYDRSFKTNPLTYNFKYLHSQEHTESNYKKVLDFDKQKRLQFKQLKTIIKLNRSKQNRRKKHNKKQQFYNTVTPKKKWNAGLQALTAGIKHHLFRDYFSIICLFFTFLCRLKQRANVFLGTLLLKTKTFVKHHAAGNSHLRLQSKILRSIIQSSKVTK